MNQGRSCFHGRRTAEGLKFVDDARKNSSGRIEGWSSEYFRFIGAIARRHFAAAAEAMRRIMIDSARRKNTQKHGGQRRRIEWTDNIVAPEDDGKLLRLDNALVKLEEEYASIADLVKLRFFAGMTIQDAARVLKISTSTAERRWTFARAWLNREMQSP